MASALELLLLTQVNYLMNNTPQLLQTVSVGVTTSSVTLTVPAGYKRMAVNWRVRSTVSNLAEQLYLQFNGDTASHYMWENLQSNNATVSGASAGGLTTAIQVATVTGGTSSANFFASGSFIVDGIADATNYATVAGNGSAYSTATNAWVGTYGGMWGNSSLVTSMQLHCSSGSIAAGSTFSMYGLQ